MLWKQIKIKKQEKQIIIRLFCNFRVPKFGMQMFRHTNTQKFKSETMFEFVFFLRIKFPKITAGFNKRNI